VKRRSGKFVGYWLWLSAELKRRNVYSITAAYAVVAFIVLQIAEITFAPLGIPNWIMITVIVAVLIGFPLIIFLAWVFQLTAHGLILDRTFRKPASGSLKPSIAVLPFADMSPNGDQGYFCEGVAEEILNSLSEISEIRIAARTSSFQFDPHAVDAKLVGRKLGVQSILEGSVRKSGSHLRISAQLIQTADGYHLWSKTYNSDLEDIFAIQDEIADNIAQSLLSSLSQSSEIRVSPHRSENVSAYDYYLRGRQFLRRFRKKDLEFALQMFQHAKDIDNKFALAWAGIADCYSLLDMYVESNVRFKNEALKASQKAAAINSDIAEVHASLGLAALVSKKYQAAELAFQHAIRLNPNLFEAYYYYGRTHFHQNHMAQAMDAFAKAAEVDPGDYQSRCLRVQILNGLGDTKLARKEAKIAIGVLESHLKWNPDDVRAYHLGAGSQIVLGRIQKACAWLNKAIEMDPNDPVVLYNAACNFALMNKIDDAILHLHKAIKYGTVSPAWMKYDNDLANLRSDDRFKQLLSDAESRDGSVIVDDQHLPDQSMPNRKSD